MRLLKIFPFAMTSLGAARINRRHWAIAVLCLILLAFLLVPVPMYDKLWSIAYGICPQRPGHSLFFGNVQMPIEAREGGMYAGFLLGAIYLVLLGRGSARNLPPRRIFSVLIGFVILMGLDGLNALAYDLYLPTPYTPNLLVRSGTGLLTGLALAGIVVPVFNQSTWRESKSVASFSSWQELGLALLLVAVFWAIGLLGWRQLLYPVSIIAITGQVVLMVGIGAMMATVLLRREGKVRNFTELAPLILIGLVAVVIMLAATSAGRYVLFGPGSMPAWR